MGREADPKSDGGFVLIYRRLWDDPMFADLTEAAVFAWMVCKAAWKPTTVRYKDRVIHLERGQLALSIRDLAKKWGWSKDKAGRFCNRLVTATAAATRTATGVNVITICNYDKYQVDPDRTATPVETEARQDRDRTATQNNKGNEGNKDNTPVGAPPGATNSDDRQGDLDTILYQRGKAVLGKSAGGQITKLKSIHGVGKALEIIETASRKETPSEYVAGVIRNGGADAPPDDSELYAGIV